MQYLINIDGFVVRSPLLLLATPLKSCTMESEILLQFHSILPKVVYFRMELHPIVQRRPRVAMVLVSLVVPFRQRAAVTSEAARADAAAAAAA